MSGISLVAALASICLGSAVALAGERAPIVESLEVAVPVAPVVITIQGTRHLVYELHITNLGATEVALTRIEVLDPRRGTVLGEFRDASLQAALGRPGMAKPAADSRQIGPGLRAVFYAWMPLAGALVPAVVGHRLELDVIRASGREPATMQAESATVHPDAVPTLGPPVGGGRWVAIYGPAAERGHRRVLYTIDGRTRIPARFAIDWMKLGDDNALTRGDPTVLANWHGYGANVLAVADATVAEAHDDIAEDTPVSRSGRPAIALENHSGNYLVLALGAGRYAHYEHLKPGSIRVKPGDKVRRGDVIASLGNTGSSSGGPHLHFHLADDKASLAAEGTPYVFEQFDVLGEYRFPGDAAGARVVPLPKSVAAARRREHPAPNAVVRF